jgi:hypothetical protein
MSPNARPDRETLLLWISAFFDGELSEADEALLFEAMENDPALEAEFLAMERTLGATAELAGLADAVMAQVAPEAVDEAGAAALLSAWVDDEACVGQRARLVTLVTDSEEAAGEALSFLHAAEGVSHTLAGLPESPVVKAAVAPLPDLVAARLASDERAAELLSALVDDAAGDAEREELCSLVTAGAAPELSFVHVSEAVAYAVRAPLNDPAAARAGAAALQAIESEAHRRQAPSTTMGAAQGSSFLERLRVSFGGFLAPAAAAACAAALFVSLEGTPGSSSADGDVPPEEWARAFLPALEEDAEAAALALAQEPLEVLADNGETEVQAIDSGSHMAAVFSTEASAITVIWVPEPSLEPSPEPEESGT